MTALFELVTVLAIPLALGAVLLRLCGFPLDRRHLAWLAIAAPLGCGAAGAAAFVSLVVTDRIMIAFELVLLGVLSLSLLARPPSAMFPPPLPANRAFAIGLQAALALVAGVAALTFVGWLLKHPSGAWDAWAFWNTKARALALGGQTWTIVFSQVVDWWHPEYPVLLPAIVARGWLLVGSETARVPALVAAVFTLGTVTLTFFTLARLRDRSSAALGALLLLGTPTFVIHGASQYADTPLGFFMLLCVAALAFADADSARRAPLLALCGLSAGLAAFMKNEGIMFLVCLMLARSVTVLAREGGREWRRQALEFSRGALAPVALVVLLKVAYAVRPVSSEFYGRGGGVGALYEHVSAQLQNPARYRGFFESWKHHLTTFDEASVPVLFVLLGYALLAGLDPERRRATTSSVALLFVLYVLGTSAVFLGWSTLEIREHMDALNRMLLQALPALTLGVLLAVPGPFAAGRRAIARRSDAVTG